MLNSKNLSVLAYSNGFTIWHYKSAEPIDAAAGAGYFDGVKNIFNPGDIIYITHAGRTEIFSAGEAGEGARKLST